MSFGIFFHELRCVLRQPLLPSLASIKLCLSLGVLGFSAVDIGLLQYESNQGSSHLQRCVVMVSCLLSGVGYA